jgi:translation initiation factor IF-2
MNEEKNMRLSQVARKLNVGTDTIIVFLATKGFTLEHKPNAKITADQFALLASEFGASGVDKQEAAHITIGKSYASLAAPTSSHDPVKVVAPTKRKNKTKSSEPKQTVPPASTEAAPLNTTAASIEPNVLQEKEVQPSHHKTSVPVLPGLKKVGKMNLKLTPTNTSPNEKVDLDTVVEPQEPPVAPPVQQEVIAAQDTSNLPSVTAPPHASKKMDNKVKKVHEQRNKIQFDTAHPFKGPKVVGKMVLPEQKKMHSTPGAFQTKLEASTPTPTHTAAPKYPLASSRKQNTKPTKFVPHDKNEKRKTADKEKQGVSSKDIESQIKKTLAKLHQGTGEGARTKYKRDKKSTHLANDDKSQERKQDKANVLQVMEFISANELASLMKVNVSEVLSTCMSLGMIVSINQRLDAEAITVITDEFGYEVDFVDLANEEKADELEEVKGDLMERPPIVTIMGHVDHGKTSLLDYIRATKIAVKEAGGITQHIGAYDITTEQGKRIVFLDTPGHEAFTAMRTRGAKVTDIIVIVVAADDSVMPQTKEAISHAQVAGCPIIIAINKIDKPQANPERVKEDLANQNILVEDWGGKYQCQEISAKTGQGVNELLEKILLEATLLELKAMPNSPAKGTIIESFLDPGRGYVVTAIVQDGTLKLGDMVLAGVFYGKVKAMLNFQGKSCKKAPPATPVQILGLNGAPRAGDTFRTMKNSKEATELAQRKQQVLREQTLRTKSQLTLDEIGRRLAVGNFKQINFIIKGDVDGSIEALADALLKLSHEEVQVHILHKCVGSITESDVLLASTADAIIIAFHIKPSAQAKKLAEKEGVEIKHYSIIYDAIDDVRNSVQGLLAPTIEEVPTGRAEIKKIFPISKIGNIAGCQVQSGFIKQSNPIRLIRKGTVVFTGSIDTLKHGLEEIKQVKSVSECGIHIKNYDLIEIGDIIEGFERKEIKRKL